MTPDPSEATSRALLPDRAEAIIRRTALTLAETLHLKNPQVPGLTLILRMMVAEAQQEQGKRVETLETALRRIADWSDCLCDHGEDCCVKVADMDYHCPGCIAATALAGEEAHREG